MAFKIQYTTSIPLTKSFQPVPQPGPGTPMAANTMYDALPEKMPTGFSKKKSKKQPSMVNKH